MAPNSNNRIQKAIILFDGECNLCNSAVKFILPRDTKGLFRFSSLQSVKGQELLNEFSLDTNNFDSVVLLVNNQVLTKSNAAITVCSALPGVWRLAPLFYIFPLFVRNWIYDVVAKNRYKVFGKPKVCLTMIPEWEDRFLV